MLNEEWLGLLHCTQNEAFHWTVPSVNVTKFTDSCRLGHI